MITLKAKFIGKTSLGFERGENYELSIGIIPKIRSSDGKLESEIDIRSSNNRCKYSTVDKFLQNWMVSTIYSLKIGLRSGSSGFSGSIGLTGSSGSGYIGTYVGLSGSSGSVGLSGTYIGLTGSGQGISTGTTTYKSVDQPHWEEVISTLRKSLRNNKLETLLSQ